MNILRNSVRNLETKGIRTLEDFSSYSRYLLQGAYLEERNLPVKIYISPTLKKQKFTYFDYKYALGQLHLSLGNKEEASQDFREILQESQKVNDRYHYALALFGTIQERFLENKIDNQTEHLINEFEIAARRISDTPIRAHLQIILASLAYHKGEFKECIRELKIAQRNSRISFADSFALSCWLSTIEGKSFRLTQQWQINLVARQTRLYFSPVLTLKETGQYDICGQYSVSLDNHAAINDLILFLLKRPTFDANLDEIQTKVWQESLKARGWKQKIRNTIMRIRDFFPYTMAPLILHNNEVRIFSEAITINLPKQQGLDRHNEICRLINTSPMTSTQLSQRLQISPATMKRELKMLLTQHKVAMSKKGRNIYYQTNDINEGVDLEQ